MGKRLKQQRRGQGSNAYRKPSHRFKADVMFRKPQTSSRSIGEVLEFIDNPMHTAPLMRVRYEDDNETVLLAPESIKVGDKIQDGPDAEVSLGNILPLKKIPDGVPVYNVELRLGDGGMFARAAGSYATVVAHLGEIVSVKLPSKTTLNIDGRCRAEIGVVAGGGMGMQPIMKAGKNHYIKHAINAKWPVNRGVKMNPVDHPFGGKQHHKGVSSTVSRHAPPGAKVGHIAARRTGRKKRG
jgi:large subunit ribosomal protein L2